MTKNYNIQNALNLVFCLCIPLP